MSKRESACLEQEGIPSIRDKTAALWKGSMSVCMWPGQRNDLDGTGKVGVEEFQSAHMLKARRRS